MPRVTSGKRYAQAAFDLAREKGELESWQAGLRGIVNIARDGKLMALMENPRLPFTAKRVLLQERLGEVNPLVLNLACLLTSHGVLRIADNILQEYAKLLDAHNGIEHAEVTTALHLDDEDKEELSRRLGEILGRKVIVEVQTDPSVLGGLRVKIGDTLIDRIDCLVVECRRKTLAEAGR